MHIADNLFVGKLVRLTAPAPEDKEAFSRWSHDAEYLRLLDSDPARPRHSEFFTLPDREKEWRIFDFRVRTLADDKLIGFVQLWVDWPNQAGGVAIGIGEPEYRGKGYGLDALQLTLAYAFRELNLYRLGLSVFSYNTRAISAYEKAGFVHEGRLRAALFRDGQRYDILYMSVLRPEWEAAMQRDAQSSAAAMHPPE